MNYIRRMHEADGLDAVPHHRDQLLLSDLPAQNRVHGLTVCITPLQGVHDVRKVRFNHITDDEEALEILVCALLVLFAFRLFLILLLCHFFYRRFIRLMRHLLREHCNQLSDLWHVFVDATLLQLVENLVNLKLTQHLDKRVLALAFWDILVVILSNRKVFDYDLLL